jgi:urea transport system substrate-binding protein
LASSEKGGDLGLNAADLILMLQGKVYADYACNAVNGRISRSSLAAIRHSVQSRVLELTLELEKLVPDAAKVVVGPPVIPSGPSAAAATQITQQIIYGLDWVQKEKNAKSFFLIGSDYIWPRTSNKIARKHIENFQKGKVVGEEYYPLGHTNFNSLINKIKVAKPDCVYAIGVGGSNVAFYKQMKAAGITSDKQLLLTISVTEDELLGIGGENCNGFYACMKYFQSLDNANNKKFVEAFKAKYGAKEVIGDVTQAAYLGPWLWKATVEKAGSFDIDKVAAASPGIELKTAPEGYVKIHENHHLWSKARIGQIQTDGQFKLIAESPNLIEPNPFPKGYQ